MSSAISCQEILGMDHPEEDDETISLDPDSCLACPAVRGDKNQKLYNLRPNKIYARPWLVYSGRLDIVDVVMSSDDETFEKVYRQEMCLCSQHFSSNFVNSSNKTLVKDAVPDVLETMPASESSEAVEYEEVLRETKKQGPASKLKAIMSLYGDADFKSTKRSSRRFSQERNNTIPAKRQRTVTPKSEVSKKLATPSKSVKKITSSKRVIRNLEKASKDSGSELVEPVDSWCSELPSDDTQSPKRKLRPRPQGSSAKPEELSDSRQLSRHFYSNQNDVIGTEDVEDDQVRVKSVLDIRVKSILTEAFLTEAYTDVTIICGKTRFRAHRLVLCAFSEFLKKIMIEQELEEEVVIVLSDYDAIDVSNVLGFLYHGTLIVDNLQDLAAVKKIMVDLGLNPPVETPKNPPTTSAKKRKSRRESAPVVVTSDPVEEGTGEYEISIADDLPDLDLDLSEPEEQEWKPPATKTKRKRSPKPSQRIPCPSLTCDKVFANYKSMQVHAAKHGEPGLKTFKCAFCEEMFETTKDRTQHERSHPDSFVLCGNCGKTYFHRINHQHDRKKRPKSVCNVCGRTVGDLKRHMMTHPGQGPARSVVCDICGKGMEGPSRLRFHKEMQHSGQKRYPCGQCLLTFGSKAELDEHIQSALKTHTAYCPICHKVLVRKEYRDVKKHLFSHAVIEAKKIIGRTCPRCHQQFATDFHLRNHLLKHYKPEWTFECSRCFLVLSSNLLMLRHQETCDGNPKPKTKPANSKKYPRTKKYARNKCPCTYCGKLLSNSFMLKVHTASIHEKKFPCRRCTLIFNTKEECVAHVATHPKVGGLNWNKRFPCVVCGEPFTSPNMKMHLLRHSKVETKNFPYPKCNRCPRSFVNMTQLQNHILVHYEPSRIFECQYCCLPVKTVTVLEGHQKRCEVLIGKKVRVRGPRSASKGKKQQAGPDIPEENVGHVGYENAWQCSQCEEKFETRALCELHIELHHSF